MDLKGGISIDADSGHLWYVLCCCGSRSQDFLTFIQICSGHTVTAAIFFLFYNRKFRGQDPCLVMFYKMDDHFDQSLFFYGRLIFDLHFVTFLHLLKRLRKALFLMYTALDIVLICTLCKQVSIYGRKIFMRSSTVFNSVRFFQLSWLNLT